MTDGVSQSPIRHKTAPCTLMRTNALLPRAINLLAGCITVAIIPAFSALWKSARRANVETFSWEAVVAARIYLGAIAIATLAVWLVFLFSSEENEQ